MRLIFCALDAVLHGIKPAKGKPSRFPPEIMVGNHTTGRGYHLDIMKPVHFRYVVQLLEWLSSTKGKACRELADAQGLSGIVPEFSESTLGVSGSTQNPLDNMDMVETVEGLDEGLEENNRIREMYLTGGEELDGTAGAIRE